MLSELQAVETAITGQPALRVPVQPNAIELARAYANRADVVQQRADEARYYEAVNWIGQQVRVPLIETLDAAIAPLHDVQQASLNEFQFFREMPRRSFDLTDYFPQFLSLPGSRPQTSSTTEGPHAGVSQPAGTTVSLTASSTGCPVPRYQFWVGYPNGAWVLK